MEQIVTHFFTLTSSSDIHLTLTQINAIPTKKEVLHISSFIHNTVLVQNLKHDLLEKYPHLKIIELHHENKHEVHVTLFSKNTSNHGDDPIEHIMLNQLSHDYQELKKELQKNKKKTLERFYTDTLSNLPNLYKLRRDLETNHNSNLVILNIDNFKIINDFYGFIVGDYIIEAFSKAIVSSTRNETVYRVAGDEFAIITDTHLNFYNLKKYLNELSLSLSHLMFSYADTEIYIDITMASSSSDQHNAFSKVNMALRYAKENKLSFWIYEDQMKLGDAYETNLKIATKIRRAIENSGIVPYFQPIVDNKTDKIAKFEVLARLIDEDGNILSPQNFISIAKKIKVYNLITRSIIEKSFEIFKNNEYSFSINLSIDDIMNQEIYNFIISMLKKSNIGHRVVFELLESEQITDYKKVSRFITEVRRYGSKVAIDDFGTGFSNFFYLTKIDPDYIKIDGSLIKDIDSDANVRVIVQTMIDFASKMNIQTIAEYVHSSTVLSEVKNMGIDYSQGFYIDKPKPELLGT
ncbi:MAG: EAL domain-containing protein [Campylobacterota bacterium]|nr:EAL domain-containing protein [Campylobacterota bacterium]